MEDVVSKSPALTSFIGGHLPSTSSSKASSSAGLSLKSAVVFESLRSSSGCGFNEWKVGVGEERGRAGLGTMQAVSGQKSLSIGKAMRWWEKWVHDNMVEVGSAQELVDSLLNADNKLVVVDFFSPGCGGCRALHPKICQFAEINPEMLFLQVNYEEHKSMCYSLNVHVLPFFRFYRGAHGRLCSFSCTNATIKKFKYAMAKHSTERCSLGPAKGLEESELLALASNKDLCFKFTKPLEPFPARGALIEEQMLSPKTPTKASSPGEKGLVTAL